MLVPACLPSMFVSVTHEVSDTPSVVCCCCISSAKFFVTVALAHIVLKFSHQGQHVSASLFKTQIWCSKLCEVIVQSCLDDEEQT